MKLISFLIILFLPMNVTGFFGGYLDILLKLTNLTDTADQLNTTDVVKVIDIPAGGLTPSQVNLRKVQLGVNAGNAIVTAIASDTYSGHFGRIGVIAKKMAPFLGAVGPIVGFINLLIPVGPSAELQLMVQEFAKIQARFDQVFARLDELESKIIEKALKAQYSPYESEISALSRLLNDYLNVSTNGSSGDIMTSRKNLFLKAYGKSDTKATLKLWQGMMKERTFSENIPYTVAEHTFNNRLLTQNYMKRVLNTIIRGVNVMMYYYEMTGDNKTYSDQRNLWISRIQELTDHMQVVDRTIRDRFQAQAQNDTEKLLAKLAGTSHKEFADSLYQFLSQKFDWRHWLVVVYNPVYGGDLHWVQYCDGFNFFRQHGRNTVVASTDKVLGAKMDENDARKKLESVPNGHVTSTGWWFRKLRKFKFYDAHTIFNKIPSDMRGSAQFRFQGPCMYAGLGVIQMYSDIHYRAPKGHLVVVDKRPYISTFKEHSFKIHAFK